MTPDALPGYCTNVHAGVRLDEIRANLLRHAGRVRELLGLHEPLPVGLWLADETSRELLIGDACPRFADWLREHHLHGFTLNGFPFRDFHQPVVKHAVYRPDWATPERRDYTIRLARILAQLLPTEAAGSISTLPLGWDDSPNLRAAGAFLLGEVALELRRIERETGRLIHVDLEPEPGCALGTSGDLVAFYENDLLAGGDEDLLRRHIRVCHDVCHAAVMFEPQAEVVQRYQSAGIAIGKVQVSSAPEVEFARLTPDGADRADLELHELSEPRYLHQTSIRTGTGQHFFDDLPDALDARPRDGHWRVHFHLPVFLGACGTLGTTQHEIHDLLAALPSEPIPIEVETYAWNVLPESAATDDLAAGIAEEIRWTADAIAGARAR